MAFGSANRTAVRSVNESVWGETPASPTLVPTRITSDSLSKKIDNVVSEELRSDRMVSDLIKVMEDGNGDIAFELSALSFDSYIEMALASTFSADLGLSGTDISASSADDSFNSSGTNLSSISVGQYIKVSGLSSGNNSGYHRVISVTSSKVIVATSLTTESAGATVDITGSMIRNGTTLKSKTIQKHFQDLVTPHFLNFRGARVGAMNLSFQVGQIITGSFSVMSKTVESTPTQISGASVSAAETTSPMSGSANVSNVQIDDAGAIAYFRRLNLSVNNNLRGQDAVGSVQHAGIALGTLDVTGDVELYFENSTLLDKYHNSTSMRLSFLTSDSSGNAYLFSFPNVKFETGDIPTPGKDTDIMFNATFRALRDSTTNAQIQIDQF